MCTTYVSATHLIHLYFYTCNPWACHTPKTPNMYYRCSTIGHVHLHQALYLEMSDQHFPISIGHIVYLDTKFHNHFLRLVKSVDQTFSVTTQMSNCPMCCNACLIIIKISCCLFVLFLRQV